MGLLASSLCRVGDCPGAKLQDRREEDRRGRDNTNPERLRQLNLSVLDVGTNSGR